MLKLMPETLRKSGGEKGREIFSDPRLAFLFGEFGNENMLLFMYYSFWYSFLYDYTYPKGGLVALAYMLADSFHGKRRGDKALVHRRQDPDLGRHGNRGRGRRWREVLRREDSEYGQPEEARHRDVRPFALPEEVQRKDQERAGQHLGSHRFPGPGHERRGAGREAQGAPHPLLEDLRRPTRTSTTRSYTARAGR